MFLVYSTQKAGNNNQRVCYKYMYEKPIIMKKQIDNFQLHHLAHEQLEHVFFQVLPGFSTNYLSVFTLSGYAYLPGTGR